MLSSTINVTND